MSPRRLATALLFLLPTTVLAQVGAGRREVTVKLPVPNSRSIWRVVKVDPSGLLALEFEGTGDAREWDIAGDALLFPKVGAAAVARVFVSDIEEKGALARTSPEAVNLFGEG